VTDTRSTSGLRRAAAWVVAGLLLLLLAGCELDGRLDESGAGTMTIRYRLMNASQLETAKKRLQSDRVKVVSADVTADKWATFRIEFPDVSALSTTEFFQKAQFTLTADGRTRRFQAIYANPDYDRLSDDLAAYFGKQMTMTLHVPGRIVDGNATRVTGDTATWTFDVQQFSEKPRVEFLATYELAATAGTPPASPAGTRTPGKHH
jgi:hypothetical protein